MNMTGERFIAAPREAVWAGLNDPEVLKACIPGCESIEMISDTQMKAVAAIKLGPVSAKFQGKVTLSDLDPPNGYKISGEGQGGPAGFAKGGAEVRLIDQAQGTLLSYTVDAQVGGKIAQIGARLIDATAKSLAEQFFKKFAAVVEKPVAEAPAAIAPAAHAANDAPGLLTRIWRAITHLFSGSAQSGKK
jgi:carbon monoxide dehydrogenase subunit G